MPARVPWAAFEQALNGKPEAFEEAMFLERFNGIV